jgi:hypothetical protein
MLPLAAHPELPAGQEKFNEIRKGQNGAEYYI